MGKHYVPQEYLRGFASKDSPDLIWMYDVDTGKWAHAAIAKVAQQSDYYSAEVESQLAELVEQPGHAALRDIRAGKHIDSTQREALAYYLAVLVMRGPRKRRKGFELIPTLLDGTLHEIRLELSQSGAPGKAEAIERLLAEVDRIEAQYRTESPPFVVEQIRSPWPGDRIIDAVRRMVWRFVNIPYGQSLITSDNPAFFFESLGLGTPEAELTFPITPTLALLGSHQGMPGTTIDVRGKSAAAREINKRMLSGTERFVFSSRKFSWVERLARGDLKLNRIKW